MRKAYDGAISRVDGKSLVVCVGKYKRHTMTLIAVLKRERNDLHVLQPLSRTRKIRAMERELSKITHLKEKRGLMDGMDVNG
jgi:hypothetical protein